MSFPVPSSPPAPPKTARFAVSVIFLVHGILVATWVLHIPTVKAALGLSESRLGVALLCIAAGSLVSMPLSGALVSRIGSRRVTVWTSLAFCAILPLPIVAPSFPVLVAALAGFGACAGAMDVAMNAHAVAVEQRYPRPVMSAFHAMFSLGGFAGAVAGGTMLSLGATPQLHALLVAGAMGAGALAVFPLLLPARADAGKPGERLAFRRPNGLLMGLGGLTFCVLLSEGAMGDWSTVYLRDTLGAGPELSAAAFGTFSLTMGAGRLVGDRLVARVGGPWLLRWGTLLAAAGLGVALLTGHPMGAVVGFGLVGVGLANTVPVLYSAGGRMPGYNPGAAIATITTAGYFGLLAGPPLIGFAAEYLTLPGALTIIVACCLLVSACAPFAGRTARPPAEAARHEDGAGAVMEGALHHSGWAE